MKVLKIFIGIVLLFLLYFLLYKLLIPRMSAFGCFDDCFNYMGGYFLLHHKKLFSEIFYNHAPFMAHLSAYIQYIARPSNLSDIILKHRQFVLLFGLTCEILLLVRFGLPVVPFAFVYELTKFYIGGDRFLAESLIVYPLVYLLGLTFKKFFNQTLYKVDYFIAAICTWFVIFMREPYALTTLVLFGAILWGKLQKKTIVACILFVILFLATILSYNIPEFFYNVITINQTFLSEQNSHLSILNAVKSFIYPLVILFQGQWHELRYIEIVISAIFLLTTIFFLKKKKLQWILFLWIVLGLSNIRLVEPGYEFYSSFHLIPWFALTIFISSAMLSCVWKEKKAVTILGFSGFAGILLFVFLSKGSYIHEKIDRQTEFITNFGNVLQVGNVVNSLSFPTDSLFIDGRDDAIYLVAKRYSHYKYSWYTSAMPGYKKYTDARIAMFEKDQPDFYYGSCPKETVPYYRMPDFAKDTYVNLFNLQESSCLWVKKSKLASITDSQWQKAGESLYFRTPMAR